MLHLFVFSDDVVKTIAVLHLVTESDIFLDQAVVVNGLPDAYDQFIVVKGFGQVIECACLHGVDSFFYLTKGGDHDNRQGIVI